MRMKPPVRYVREHEVVDGEGGEQTMRLRRRAVGEKLTALSVEGRSYKCETDGTVFVHDEVVPRLLKEGWTTDPREGDEKIDPHRPRAEAPPAGQSSGGEGKTGGEGKSGGK